VHLAGIIDNLVSREMNMRIQREQLKFVWNKFLILKKLVYKIRSENENYKRLIKVCRINIRRVVQCRKCPTGYHVTEMMF
jgi:hypothetical protein